MTDRDRERCCSHDPIVLTLRAGGLVFLAPCQIALIQPPPEGTTMTRVRLQDGLDVFVQESPEVVLVQRRHVLGAVTGDPLDWKFHDVVATSDIGPVEVESGGGL